VSENNLSALGMLRAPHDLYGAYGALKGATVTGEKSPFFCNRLELLHDEYPSAAFVFVWRNPAEVYRSVLRPWTNLAVFWPAWHVEPDGLSAGGGYPPSADY
jgi:hypothetical protein